MAAEKRPAPPSFGIEPGMIAPVRVPEKETEGTRHGPKLIRASGENGWNEPRNPFKLKNTVKKHRGDAK
jgi:hypothetical protein